MDIYFIFWVITNTTFIDQIAPALAIGNSFNWRLCPLNTPRIVRLCFSALPYFLALQDAPGFSCTFVTPVLEWVISPRDPGSFYWRMVFETKSWELCVIFISCYTKTNKNRKLNKQTNKQTKPWVPRANLGIPFLASFESWGWRSSWPSTVWWLSFRWAPAWLWWALIKLTNDSVVSTQREESKGA